MMFNLQVFAVCALFCMVVGVIRLDYNSTDCNKYLEKFWKENSAQENRSDVFTVNGSLTEENDIKISLGYSDDAYFHDPFFQGLVQEDGKQSETTCLDLKLLQFPSDIFQNGAQVTDLKISPSNNTEKLMRYYSFVIKQEDFATKLSSGYQGRVDIYYYTGYYGIAFYAAETDELQYTFNFEFSILFFKKTGMAIDVNFWPQTKDFKDQYKVSIKLALTLCKDFSCSTILKRSDITLNDEVVVWCFVLTPGLDQYYLKNPEIFYILQSGSKKKANIIQMDNSIASSIKCLIISEFDHKSIYRIKAYFELSTSRDGSRLLSEPVYNSYAFENQPLQIQYDKAKNSGNCFSYEEECYIKGLTRDKCPLCINSGSTIPYAIILKIFWFIF